MVMEILRWIPHFTYGNCGGASNKCTTSKAKPIDAMDKLFQKHDKVMYETRKIKHLPKGKRLRKASDDTLYYGLLRLNTVNLSLYGKMYHFFALKVFKPR